MTDFKDIVKKLEGAEIVMPVRKTFYGMNEIAVHEPGGPRTSMVQGGTSLALRRGRRVCPRAEVGGRSQQPSSRLHARTIGAAGRLRLDCLPGVI